MLTVFIVLFRLILVIWTPCGFAALPKWVHRVKSCPDPWKMEEWMEGSERLNCYNNLSSNHKEEQEHVYHCLPSSFLNETVEFCGRSVPIQPGKCPVYNYVVHINRFPTAKNCSSFTYGCPREMFFSKMVYMYPTCLKINKKERCFEAEKNCKNSTNNEMPIKKSSFKILTIALVSGITILIMTIAIGSYCFRKHVCVNDRSTHDMRTKLEPKELDDISNNSERENAGSEPNTKDQYNVEKYWTKSIQYKENELIRNLNENMSEEQFLHIKSRLQDCYQNELDNISNSMDLLNFLKDDCALSHNLLFIQAILWSCGAKKLHDICVKYAKSRENMQIIFFEVKKSILGFTKVKYKVSFPKNLCFTNMERNKLREMVALIINAKDDDILLHGIKQGCVILTFLIKDLLIPTLKSAYSPEKLTKTRQLMSDYSKHKILKVMIEDTTIYENDASAFTDQRNPHTTICKHATQSSEKEKNRRSCPCYDCVKSLDTNSEDSSTSCIELNNNR